MPSLKGLRKASIAAVGIAGSGGIAEPIVHLVATEAVRQAKARGQTEVQAEKVDACGRTVRLAWRGLSRHRRRI
jgi:hypothetical protein